MKKIIVAFGDSNTHGYNAQTGGRFSEEERWTCLLEQYLGTEYRVMEEGLSGRTTVFDDPLFEGLSGLSAVSPCLLTHEPVDLLIIMLGTNDAKARFCCNAENIAKGLERLAHKAIATQGAWRHGPRLLLIAPAPIEDGYAATPISGEMGPGCAEKSRQLAFWYEALAERLGCCFLDAGAISGMGMHPNDHMHLDKKSHELLARALARLIPSII